MQIFQTTGHSGDVFAHFWPSHWYKQYCVAVSSERNVHTRDTALCQTSGRQLKEMQNPLFKFVKIQNQIECENMDIVPWAWRDSANLAYAAMVSAEDGNRPMKRANSSGLVPLDEGKLALELSLNRAVRATSFNFWMYRMALKRAVDGTE